MKRIGEFYSNACLGALETCFRLFNGTEQRTSKTGLQRTINTHKKYIPSSNTCTLK